MVLAIAGFRHEVATQVVAMVAVHLVHGTATAKTSMVGVSAPINPSLSSGLQSRRAMRC